MHHVLQTTPTHHSALQRHITAPANHLLLHSLPLPYACLPRLAGIPTVSSLMNHSASIASLLGIRLPPINYGALAARYVAEMGLADVRPSMHNNTALFSLLSSPPSAESHVARVLGLLIHPLP
jgi:hypothetical protein